MLKALSFFILFFTVSLKETEVGYVKADHHPVYFRTAVSLESFYNPFSDFSVAFLTCNNFDGLKAAIRSFALYNTKRVSKLYIYERCREFKTSEQPEYQKAMPKEIEYENQILLSNINIFMNVTGETYAIQ